jgi:hypothetical protein
LAAVERLGVARWSLGEPLVRSTGLTPRPSQKAAKISSNFS